MDQPQPTFFMYNHYLCNTSHDTHDSTVLVLPSTSELSLDMLLKTEARPTRHFAMGQYIGTKSYLFRAGTPLKYFESTF